MDQEVSAKLAVQVGAQMGEQVVLSALDERRRFLLLSAAEKAKKDLSLEGLDDVQWSVTWGEKEASATLSHEEFEGACERAGLCQQVYDLVYDLVSGVQEAGAVRCVELVGSASRMKWVEKKVVQAVRHVWPEAALTALLNKEEACARGCTLFAQRALAEPQLSCPVQSLVLHAPREDSVLAVYGVGEAGAARGFTVRSAGALKAGKAHDCRAAGAA